MNRPYDTFIKWQQFRRANPGVYDFCVERAREAKNQYDYKRIGFPHIWNLVRWEYGVKAKNTDFAANNDYAPFYCRLIMMNEPDLFEFFEVRASGADELTGWNKFKMAKAEPVNPEVPKPVQSQRRIYFVEEDDDVVA